MYYLYNLEIMNNNLLICMIIFIFITTVQDIKKKNGSYMLVNKFRISDHLSFLGDIDGMKNSPANGPGTPPVSMPGYVSDGLSYQDNVSQMNLWVEYINLWKMLKGQWLLPKLCGRVIVLLSL